MIRAREIKFAYPHCRIEKTKIGDRISYIVELNVLDLYDIGVEQNADEVRVSVKCLSDFKQPYYRYNTKVYVFSKQNWKAAFLARIKDDLSKYLEKYSRDNMYVRISDADLINYLENAI